jgi:hypothetical protein
MGPSNWVLSRRGGAALANAGEMAALPAGGGVGVDHMLT